MQNSSGFFFQLPHNCIPIAQLPAALREAKQAWLSCVSVAAIFSSDVEDGDLVRPMSESAEALPDNVAEWKDAVWVPVKRLLNAEENTFDSTIPAFWGIAFKQAGRVLFGPTVQHSSFGWHTGDVLYADKRGKLTTTNTGVLVGFCVAPGAIYIGSSASESEISIQGMQEKITALDSFTQGLETRVTALGLRDEELASFIAENVRQINMLWNREILEAPDIPRIVYTLEEVEKAPQDGMYLVPGMGSPSTEEADISNRQVLAVGAAVPRALGSRFADIINVKDFGAVGDGATDDTQSIKAAIAALKTRKVLVTPPNSATAGPTLFFPFGVYLISETLSIEWCQRVGVYLDGATIRATASMDAMLYVNNNWMEGNTISGGCWDMARLAKKGVHITKLNRSVCADNIKIKNVGDGGVGLYLGTVGEDSGDGQSFRITNVVIDDWIANDSDENGNLLYDAIGMLVAVNDCHFNNLVIGCCSTGIKITGGGHTFSGVHVWQGMTPPEHSRWNSFVGVMDLAGDNEWDNFYSDNNAVGYYIKNNAQVAIGNFQWSRREGTPSEPAKILSYGYHSYVNIDYLFVRWARLYSDAMNIVAYNRDSLTSHLLIQDNATITIKHTIRNTAPFKLIDPAFDEINNPMQAIANTQGENLADGYYLLGYIATYGTGSCKFSVGVANAVADIEFTRSGQTVRLECIPKIGGALATTSFAVGVREDDSMYNNFPYYPVYLKKSTGAAVFSNIRVRCESRTPSWAFYKVAANSCASVMVSSPSILVEKTFSNT